MGKVVASITKKIYDEEVTLTIEGDVEKGGDYTGGMSACLNQIRTSMDYYALTIAPQGHYNPDTIMAQNVMSVDHDLRDELVTSFRLSLNKGKKGLRVITAKNSKWGVPIYPEVSDQYNIGVDMVEGGDYKVDHHVTAKVLYKDGKPSKVVELDGWVTE